MSKITNINGPINTIRLEGVVNGIDKVIYVFFDLHHDISDQTKCRNVLNIDINQYLMEIFKHHSEDKKIYDFFFETNPPEILDDTGNDKKKYIDELSDLFNKSFKMVNNKVTKSTVFPKVRLHYVDIRFYFGNSEDLLFSISEHIDDMYEEKEFDNSHINDLNDMVEELLNGAVALEKKIYSGGGKKIKKPKLIVDNISFSELSESDIKNNAIYLINKIKSKYSHKSIQKKILNIINGELKMYFKLYKNKLNIMIKNLKKIDIIDSDEFNPSLEFPTYGSSDYNYLNILKTIYNDWYICFQYGMLIHSLLIDLFFMRRFLDKDYITRSISYTGAYHSTNYVYFLVKYFGFKITDYSYLEKSPKKVESHISRMDLPHKLIPYVFKKKLIQCSDLKSFPQNLG